MTRRLRKTLRLRQGNLRVGSVLHDVSTAGAYASKAAPVLTPIPAPPVDPPLPPTQPGPGAILPGSLEAYIQNLDAGVITAGVINTSRLNIQNVIVGGAVWTDNSPGAGSVAWSACTVWYNGTAYAITGNNTASKYIWWSSTTSNTTFQSSDTRPTLTDAEFLIASNVSGAHDLLWNAVGNSGINPAHINFESMASLFIYGDGVDGDVTVPGNATVFTELFTATTAWTATIGTLGTVASNILTAGSFNASTGWGAKATLSAGAARLSVQGQMVTANDGGLIAYFKDASNNYLRVTCHGGSGLIRLEKNTVAGGFTQLVEVAQAFTVGNWYWLELERKIDNTLVAKVYNSGASPVAKASATLLQTLNSSFTEVELQSSTLIVIESYCASASKWGGQGTGSGGIYAETFTGTLSLVRDMSYNSLTVASGSTLNTNGYRVFVKNTLTNNGTIKHDGGDGTAGGAGTGATSGNIGGGSSGATPPLGAANGVNGNPLTNGLGALGGRGGAGGAFTGGLGGAKTQTLANRHGLVLLSTSAEVRGGTAGGSGASDSGGSRGGGGGGGGGIIIIAARTITNNGTIQSKGGAGGPGQVQATFHMGGGGGGGGGAIVLIYRAITQGTLSVAGGAGGDGATSGGSNGSAGNTGLTLLIQQEA